MFRLRVLGGFALDGPPGTAPALSKRRAEAVLAVLAVCGDLGCTRERLLALLWPESDEAGARQGLRDALHAIRRTIGSGAVPSVGRVLRLDPAVVLSDALQFTQALASGRPADAVRLYAGPLLDGFHVDDAAEFERWLDGERARLAREYGEALRQLATGAEAAGAWSEAQSWWARAVEHDPLNSNLVLQQVRVLAAVGDRAGAIRVAEGHARRLREEFDLEPDREILTTIERIRRGELPPARAERPVAAVEPTPPQAADAPAAPAEPALVTRPASARRVPRWVPWAAGVAVLVLGGAYAAGRLPETRAEASASRAAVAVLPFRNLSEDTSYAYVARGLHDELLTQLAKVSSLRVIGRASVLGYEETSKPLRQIGEELGVGSIVEAGVQVDGNRLRVTVHLLDPTTQTHVWAERYDRTLDDAFAVQSDIAQRIVAAVGARLTSAEGGAIAEPPTQVAGAYESYLQGLTYQRRPGFLWENYRIAQGLYQRALALDPDFALAHAALATVHVTMHKLRYDFSSGRLAMAQREAETALRLAPGLPQAHIAMAGVRYHAGGRFREALEEINLALRGAPNDPEIWAWMGLTQLSLGSWDSAVAAFEHARRLDPRDPNVYQLLGDTYHFIRRYPEAIEAYRHASAFAPDLVQPRLSAGWSYFLWRGELDTLRRILREVPPGVDPGWGGGSLEHQRLILLLWERRPDSVLALLRGMPPAPDMDTRAVVTRALVAAEAHRLRGDSAAARAGFDAVATLLSEDRTHPDDPTAHIGRGLALAALGRRAEALREVRWLERFEAERQDRHDAGTPYWTALILTRVGETGAALDRIERLLAGPSLFSVHELRISPDFDPLRGDARYAALLERYASNSLPAKR
jgi:TolB-like protein/DNA-binding SARP family transcriptional activator/Flp pilus assembly protein TadD